MACSRIRTAGRSPLQTAIDGRNVSGFMHMPTTMTLEPSGAALMMASIIPGTPTHSKITGRFGPAAPVLRRRGRHAPTRAACGASPSTRGRVHPAAGIPDHPLPRALSYGDSTSGSTRTDAPHRPASAARRREITGDYLPTPIALSWQITAADRPAADDDSGIALLISLRRTACRPPSSAR